ncbi:uncharacterized protein [Panulirus ornatus]
MYKRLITRRKVLMMMILLLLCFCTLWTSMNLHILKRRHLYLNEGVYDEEEEPYEGQVLWINEGNQLNQADEYSWEGIVQQGATSMPYVTEEQTLDEKSRISHSHGEISFSYIHHQATVSHPENGSQQIALVSKSFDTTLANHKDRVFQTPFLSTAQGTGGKDFLNSEKLEAQKQFQKSNYTQDEAYAEKNQVSKGNNAKSYNANDSDRYDDKVKEDVSKREKQTVDVIPKDKDYVNNMVYEEKKDDDGTHTRKEDVALEEKERQNEAPVEKEDVASNEKETIKTVALKEGEGKDEGPKDESNEKENEDGETPVHPRAILLVSTWRSGSSFLGELLSLAKKDSFYSFEPLHGWNDRPYERDEDEEDEDDDDDKREALNTQTYLRDILQCHFLPYPRQVAHMSRQGFYQKWNTRLTKACRPVQRCNDTKFVSDVCMKSSLHIAKVVRLPLADTVGLLAFLRELKVLHLVRDPRAVMNSRQRDWWCMEDNCRDPETVCRQQLEDFSFSSILHHHYPGRYKFIRYEDLSLNPLETIQDLWKFLELELTPRVVQIIQQRTNSYSRNRYSTRRISHLQTFQWRKEMKYSLMQKVQRACPAVLELLGLRVFTSKKEYKNLSLPILLASGSPFLRATEK